MTDFTTIAPILSRWLAHSLWQGAVVLLVWLVVMRVARRHGAVLESRASSITIVLIACLPLFTAVAGWMGAAFGIEGQAVQAGGARALTASAQVLRAMQQHLTFDVARWVVGAWLAGVLLSLTHLLVSFLRFGNRIRRESRIIELPGLAPLAARMGLARTPEVREWSHATSPFVTGWLRPVVVVPPALEHLLGRAEAESVLLHELAHVARRDVACNLLLRVLGALAWYQVPLWAVLRDLERARERACDDLAVGAMGRSLPLARALVLLEERRQGEPRFAMAGTGGHFSSRVRRILGPIAPLSYSRFSSVVVLASLFLATATTLLLAASAEGSLRRWASGVHAMVSAHDPAGPFTVELMGSRLVGATIDGRAVSPERIVQRGSWVALLAADGRPELTLRVEAPGTIHWTPRAPRSP